MSDPTKAIDPKFVTPGNAAWVLLEGGVVPQKVWDELAASQLGESELAEANKNCYHEFTEEIAEIKTVACVKCGLVVDISPEATSLDATTLEEDRAERRAALYAEISPAIVPIAKEVRAETKADDLMAAIREISGGE